MLFDLALQAISSVPAVLTSTMDAALLYHSQYLGLGCRSVEAKSVGFILSHTSYLLGMKFDMFK